ncbi:biotin--[acetyl-CoA-carboxylase] ligase [Stenomitos frigidus]|uniref:biotin--[biotin carboxyl-carrier protein] ligase n=1 Tax=Stenomitos frigidus ULC18 TaxID=2107698 RepID=A0A2T1E7A1_9CYAN|nr:biotin--[acetyl-CoA-carboxylase] ligase [Stenomitos frigidus]PSB28610.1 biotin--[acetyl-CoA-carboxylase] ligase [Stenomitos frigidus ULC18]
MARSQSQLPVWLHWLDTCPSTNSWAIAHRSSLRHGDVVFTPQQTAGRGQHGRVWQAPPGVLTASFVLESISVAQLPVVSLGAGLSVIYAVEDLLPNLQNTLRLKWSNDVLLDGRKLAGILCEATANGSMGRVIVGIGLNCCVDFEQAGLGADAIGQALSLHQVVPIVPEALALLERLRHYLLQTAGLLQPKHNANESTGLTALLPALRNRDALLGHTIIVETDSEQVAGEAVGISDRGHLLLRLPNGEVRSFVSGHILWQKHETRLSI